MPSPKQTTFWIRRGVLLVTGLLTLYLLLRFRTYPLKAAPELLPIRFEQGETLLLDTRPRAPEVGDAWLVRTDGGELALGVIESITEQSMAMLFGRKAFDRSAWVWIPKSQRQSRVLFVLPF